MAHDFAVVTGAAGLLGVEHAIALQAEGLSVVMTDLKAEAIESRMRSATGLDTSKIEIAELDVTDESDIEQFAQRFDDSNQLRVLVNNAQGSHPDDHLTFDESSYEAWQAILTVTLDGTFLCCRSLGNKMIDTGSIINMSSVYGLLSPDFRIYDQVGFSSSAAYTTAKSGLIGLTRYLAVYWAKRSLRVNCVSPGGVFNDQPSEFTMAYSNRVPMGRMSNVNEMQGVVGWLASDSSSYVTGQNIVVDGGLSAW